MNTSVDTNAVTNSLAPSKAFTEKELKGLGLSINDASEIDRVACSIDHEKPITISQFGRQLGIHIAAGRLKLTELAALEEDIAQPINNDPTDLQRLSDLRPEKKISGMRDMP